VTSRIERLVDRANPVLVKEIRAALRGRWFKFSFVIVLTVAMVTSLFVIAISGADGGGEDRPPSGSVFFYAMLACVTLGVNMLVPFSAMLSMNAESDENTLELLQLSGLGGWRIVLGKLASSLTQAVLILSAFLPFLAFAFVLKGIDVFTVVAAVAMALMSCVAQSSLGIWLGTLTKSRWSRVLSMFFFGVVLLQTGQLGAVMVMGTMFSMRGTMSAGGPSPIALPMLAMLAIAILFVSSGATRLAHPEENRSTPVRVATTGLVLLGCGFSLWASGAAASSSILLSTATLTALPMWLIACEREGLPRVIAARLPSWARRYPFLAPWLPGGGFGALFVVLHLLFIAVIALVPNGSATSTGVGMGRGVLLFTANLVVYLLLVPGLMSFSTRSQPTTVRVVTLLFAAAVNIVPALIGAFLGRPDLARLAPIVTAFDSSLGSSSGFPLLVLGVLAALALLVNARRMIIAVRGFAWLRARAIERDAPEEAHAATDA